MSDADAIAAARGARRERVRRHVGGDRLGGFSHHRRAASRAFAASVAVSFGSCSFREPVDELRTLTIRLMTTLDGTHAPELRSWVESANDAATDFPIQNLPFGVFRRAGSHEAFRVGVAIGDQILDLDACAKAKLLARRRSPLPPKRCRAADAQRASWRPGATRRGASPRAERAAARRLAGRRARRQIARTGCSCRCATPSSRCRRRSATTPTSTRRSSMRRTSAACSARTTRCCRTTSGCRSGIMAGARRSCSAARTCMRPAGQTRDGTDGRAVVRAEPAPGLRARGGRVHRRRQRARRADRDRRGRGAHLRALPAQRLVGARHPDVGVPAARSVPREELRDDDLALGGDARRAGALPRAGVSTRPEDDPQPLPYLSSHE